MTFGDYYQTPFAYNPSTNTLVTNREFSVHLPTDLGFLNPLTVTEPISGVAIPTLKSNSVGALPEFAVPGEPPQILLRAGDFVTKLTSIFGAVIAAGLDAQTVQKAIASADRAEKAAARAEAAGGGSAGLSPEPGMSGYYLI